MKNYSPQFVTISYQGINITGFADGTFIEAERTADGFTKKVGAGGDVVRVQSMDRTGKVTVTLQSQSATNDLLMAIAKSDELTGAAFGSLMIKDINTASILPLVFSKEAWIMKIPKIDRAKEALNVVWVFECADIDLEPSGAVF